MRTLLVVVASTLFVACSPGGSSGSQSIEPLLLTVDRDTARGAAVEIAQTWPTVKPREYGCIVPVGGEEGRVPSAILRLDTYITGRTPLGGLIRETMVVRHGAGELPEYSVAHDLRTLCAGDDCTETELYFACYGATALPDQGMAAIVQLYPWSANESFTAIYLVRFGASGELVFKHKIEDVTAGYGLAVGTLRDGTIALAHPVPAAGSAVIKRFSPAGTLLGTSTIEGVDSLDTGSGIPGAERPSVATIVPLEDGGFVAVGNWNTARDIECYSGDAPKPPTTSTCGELMEHGLLARFTAAGEKVAVSTLGRSFLDPDSSFNGAVELANGDVIATGHVAGDPVLVRSSAGGRIEAVTKLCPCGNGKPSSSALRAAGTITPLARGNDVDFIVVSNSQRSSSPTLILMRYSAAGEISAVRPYLDSAMRPAVTDGKPFTAGSRWFVFNRENDADYLRTLGLATE